jgi:hypothetical protein
VTPSGNLNSKGQLLSGKTIYINLDSLVYFGEVVLANVTAAKQSARPQRARQAVNAAKRS